jgi:hypothetical protein
MSAENSGQGVNANRLVMDILSARLYWPRNGD